jgi:hypothetical protein
MVAVVVPYDVEDVLRKCTSKTGKINFISMERDRKLLREWFGKQIGVPSDDVGMLSCCGDGRVRVCIWQRNDKEQKVDTSTGYIEISFRKRIDCILLDECLSPST